MTEGDEGPPNDAGPPPMPAVTGRRRGRPFVYMLLAAGLALAFYVSSRAPKEQHVRFVLGSAAPRVTRLSCDYLNADGLARSADYTFDRSNAPRVVAHDPELPSGDYTLEVRVFSKDGQNTIERRVRLETGTVSVDLAESVP